MKHILLISLTFSSFASAQVGGIVKGALHGSGSAHKYTTICGKPDQKSWYSAYPIQDQDSLGTCYAHQVSLMVQNSLKTSKTISPLSVAIMANTGKKNFFDSDGDHMVNGGDGCDAFKELKRYGFCYADQLKLSSLSEDSLGAQAALLESLSRYMETDRGKNMSEKDWDNLKKIISQRLSDKKKLCPKGKKEFVGHYVRFLAPMAIQKEIDEIKKCQRGTTRSLACPEAITNLEKSLKRSLTHTEIENIKKELQESLDKVSKIRLKGYSNDYLQRVLNYDLHKRAMDLAYDETVVDQYGSLFTQFTMNSVHNLKLSHFTNSPLRDIEAKINQEYDLACIKGLKSPEIFAVDPGSFRVKSVLDCNESTLDPASVKEVDDLFKSIRPILENPNAEDKAKRLLGGMSSACEKELGTARSRLSNMSCKYYDLKSQSNSQGRQSLLDNHKAKMEDILCKGGVIGIDICTEFMNNPYKAIDTDFCKNRGSQNGIRNHALHAMTITGLRAHNGRQQFMVQNSWGKYCSHQSTLNQVECEKDDQGNPTGRFWIDAERLLINSLGYSHIEGGK